MASVIVTPVPTPIPFSMTPPPIPVFLTPSPAAKDEIEETLFDLKKYKWTLIIIAILLVVLLLALWFWGRNNNTTNAVRIGGGKVSKKFASSHFA